MSPAARAAPRADGRRAQAPTAEVDKAMEELILETRAANVELEEDFKPLLPSAETSAVARRQLAMEEALTEV